ncbi:ankycorbin-like isoform X2 [Lytechinus variegatus]|uniref:ankycorbin-like isoform X2 n=1 Tax=Lytechinus variegatus TaxID=7654 RepID=UPI001BB26312|nr:ankycorbin-like isoform X2 [Lytechinus variegatus]
MFKKLKRQNKDKEFEWTKNDDKVMHAIEVGDIEKLQITLAKKGTSPTKLDGEGRTPLHVAAQKGQYPCLEVLLQLGANPRASDGQGCTALHCASKGGHLNSMHRLIKAGVPINAQDFNGKTALHFSAGSGHIESTILLLQCGASIDIADEYGKTPLMVAASSGHTGVCKDLIDRRADVNSQDHIQKTPLMSACENGHRETVELLIKRGARADLCDAQGYDAKYYAEGSGQDNVAELLETAPSVATWDVRNEEEEAYDEVAPDAVDYIDTFDVNNERADSPPPNKNHQNNIEADFPTPSRAVSMPALTDKQSDDLKELEEENDFLNEELSKVNVAHKKALERIRSLESKVNDVEVASLKERLESEEMKRKEQEKQMKDLENRLTSMKLKVSKDSFEEDEEDETNSVGSWGDSEDDLFDLPGTKKTPRTPLNLSLDLNSSKQKSDVQLLKTEIEELRKENENLKNQLESGEVTPAGTVSRAEFERLRLSSNGRIADLEEELASLKEELEESDRGNMVPYQEYQELKEANEEELSVVKLENIVLKDEIGNVSQRLAEMTDKKERLQEQVMEQQELQLRPVSSSSADFRYNELVQEKLEMEEIISKHSEVLAKQADEMEVYRKEINDLKMEKEEMEMKLGESSGSREEMNALKKENDRLQAMITKQSKAIAQQTDRMRKDKIKYSEVVAERDGLVKEMQASQKTGSHGDGELEERRELEAENRRLMERVGLLERQFEHEEEERTKIEELTGENWRLQDTLRKAEDEMLVKSAQLSKILASKTTEHQGFEEENRQLKKRNKEIEIELSNRRDGEAQYSQILAENLSLKTRLSQLGDGGLQNGDQDWKHSSEVFAENRKLKETIKKMEGTHDGLMNGMDGGGGGGKANLKEVTRLKQQIAEMDARHRDTVNIYRAHLLSAVRDEISPDVKEALQQIVKLRNETPVT